MSAIVTLKKGEGRTIKAGGMWVFDNEIDTVTGTFENGEVVLVHDFDGYPMGRGFINVNSKIRVRMLTRKIDLYSGNDDQVVPLLSLDRKSTRLNSSHSDRSRMPSSA